MYCNKKQNKSQKQLEWCLQSLLFKAILTLKKTPKIYIQYIFFETVTLFKTNIVVISEKKKSLYYLDF